MTLQNMVEGVLELAHGLTYEAVSIGYPGVIKKGIYRWISPVEIRIV